MDRYELGLFTLLKEFFKVRMDNSMATKLCVYLWVYFDIRVGVIQRISF